MSRTRPLAALLALTVATACSSTYTPRRGPRVSLVLDSGSPALVRDGVTRPLGVLGGGLPDTVADHPGALEHADEFHSRMTTALVMMIGGLGLMTASPVMLQRSNRGDLDNLGPAAGMLAGGLAIMYGGLFVTLSAQPHLYDAINVYNDAVDQGFGLPAGVGIPATNLPVPPVAP
ncbi:MAG: hypothetical protein EXR79_14245 [Myxococcales bacterium]|nr:hypothetical protein [Myxococcales bacterium]